MPAATITVEWLETPPEAGALLYRVGDAGKWQEFPEEPPEAEPAGFQFAKVLGFEKGTLNLEAVDDPNVVLHPSTDPSED